MAALGVMVSLRWPSAKPGAEWLIVPLLVLVLFSLFARVSLARLRDAARDWRYLLTALGLNFVSPPPRLRLGLAISPGLPGALGGAGVGAQHALHRLVFDLHPTRGG